MNNIDRKYASLLKYIRELENVAIAFSGGTDSTFLLYVAKKELGENVLAITVKSPYIPDWEVEEAKNFCIENNIKHHVINVGIADEIVNNPYNRCYLCKKRVFGTIYDEAKKLGFTNILDGTNADDTNDYRPGLKALQELEVKSPLLVAGLKKEEIRTLSRKFGLSTAEKPAYACLLTRLPYDYVVDENELIRIEKAEIFLMSLGFKASRVRNHGKLARIEIRKDDITDFFISGASGKVSKYFRNIGYHFVTVDIDGYRTGSFNLKTNEGQ